MSKTVSFRVGENLYKLLHATAQKRGTRLSKYVRRKLIDGLRKEYGIASPKSEEQIGILVGESEEDEIDLTDEEIEKRVERIVEEKLKNTTPAPPKVEPAEIRLSDDEIERELKALENKPDEDDYVCGGCGYQQKGEFNPCPKCGKKLRW